MSAERTCPSARAVPGNRLLAIKGPDGRMKPLRTAMEIDEGFVAEAERYGSPEARMRFAAPCATSGCSQWTGSRCGVIDKVMDFLEAEKVPLRADLPPCAIRATCRWYDQSGARACKGCELVTTDMRAPASA